SHAAYPHRTTGEIGAGTVIGEDVSEDDSYPVGEPVFLVCGHCGDLSAPAAGARTVATVVRSLGKPLWRVDPGAGSGAYLRYERITFHELLQARDWPIVHGIPESLPDRTSSGLAGHDGKTDVGDQPGNKRQFIRQRRATRNSIWIMPRGNSALRDSTILFYRS